MDAEPAHNSTSILVLEKGGDSQDEASQSIHQHFPQAAITTVNSLEACKRIITDNDFDIVVMDCDLRPSFDLAIVHQLKIKDYEPAVLLVSESLEPAVLNEINNLGCQRYLYKHGDWINHLGTAIRQLLRIRRLESENRRLVAQLTEAKMFLEDKNRRLDEFCATVAHDIRGPLGGISMKLEYLIERYCEKNDERFRVLMQRGFDSCRRLIDIVQAMYGYAKIGSKSAKMEAVNLHKLMQEVIQDMSFDEKLDIQIGLGELPVVWGNEGLLRRIFINLLGNAVKYSDKQPIIINAGLERMIDKTLGRFARIFVADNGPGIPHSEQKAIFSMFRSGSNCAKGDSLGVGLAVVQRIVELHFGDVAVESEPGMGTRFLLTLPVDKIEFLE